MNLLTQIKEYLSHSRSECNGIIVLLGLLLLVIAAHLFLPLFVQPINIDREAFLQMIDSFYVSDTSDIKENTKHDSLFYFDPNHCSQEDWMKLGLSEKQAKVILNYLNAGGRFTSPSDLRKIYSISGELYTRLEPYIMIPPPEKKITTQRKLTHQPQSKTELNSVDSSALLALRGIGPVFAGRIIKYRKLLGGFYHKEQLLEVYGMDTNRLKMFMKDIRIDTTLIKKTNINTSNFKNILKHPYISYPLTKAIFKFRDKQNIINNMSELRDITHITDSLINKLKPYLDFSSTSIK